VCVTKYMLSRSRTDTNSRITTATISCTWKNTGGCTLHSALQMIWISLETGTGSSQKNEASLPGLSTFCCRMRSEAILLQTPIVLVTSNSLTLDAEGRFFYKNRVMCLLAVWHRISVTSGNSSLTRLSITSMESVRNCNSI